MKLIHISIEKNSFEIELLSFPQKQGWVDYCGLFVFSADLMFDTWTVVVDILFMRRLICWIAWRLFPPKWDQKLSFFHEMFFQIPRIGKHE